MQLSVRDLADASGMPPSVVYRWLKHDGLPGDKVLDEYRFNRLEVLDWSIRKGIPLKGVLFQDVDELEPGQTPLTAALEAGGTAPLPGGLLGTGTVAALEKLLPELDPAQRRHVLEPIGRRNLQGWACLPDLGVAVPRATRPLICDLPACAVRVFYPEAPGAVFPPEIARQPVMAWVWILARTPACHLLLLERLAKLILQQRLMDVLVAQQPAAGLVPEMRRREEALSASLQPHLAQEA